MYKYTYTHTCVCMYVIHTHTHTYLHCLCLHFEHLIMVWGKSSGQRFSCVLFLVSEMTRQMVSKCNSD